MPKLNAHQQATTAAAAAPTHPAEGLTSVTEASSAASRPVTGPDTHRTIPGSAETALRVALECVARRWPVFPVNAASKIPAVKGWPTLATWDEDTIRGWFGDHGAFPFAVPGIATGKLSNLLAVDLDVASEAHPDARGEETFRAKAAQWEHEGGWGDPLVAGTPSRGRHLLYRYPEEGRGADADPAYRIGNRADLYGKGSGVDIRGDGGFILAPGLPGRDWLNETENRAPGNPPAWLLADLISAGATQEYGERPRGRATLAELLKNPAADGGRNQWLAAVAGQFAARENHRDTYEVQCRDAATKLVPPLDSDEVEKVIASIWKAEQAKRKALSTGKEPVEGEVQGRAPSTADQLVELALRHFDLARADDNTPVAIPKVGGRHALPLRGGGGVRQWLAAALYRQAGKTPTQSALADALGVLTGMAYDAPVVRTSTRVARAADDSVEIDLGDETGHGIRVTPTGWDVVARTTEAFTRTALTRAYPMPTRGGSVDDLFGLVNVNDEDKDQLVAWMVAALIPDIPHAILLLAGEQGTGKSDCTEMLATLLDPSGAPKRSQPRDENQWHVQVAGSWLWPGDNLSTIPHWHSDAMCRVVTGDGDVRRELYTDGDLIVRSVRRVVLINGIGLTALRGDLADRLMRVELQVIPRSARKEHKVLMDQFQALRPGVFGALLDLLSQVLSVQAAGGVHLEELPRLADFARVVAAVDKIRGTNALESFLRTQDDVTAQVAGDDPVTEALERLLGNRNGAAWSGTATRLTEDLDRYRPHPTPKSWPGGAVGLAQRLAQLAPGLRARGIEIELWRKKSGRGWTIARTPEQDSPEDPQQPLPGGQP